jgi:uncharacterized membrane protein YdjX (TVP38/TMEM64 family)
MKTNGYKKYIIIASASVAIVLLVRFSGVNRYLTLASLKENRALLHALVEKNYWSFLASYLCIDICLTCLPIPVTALFSLAGGLFFGTWLGALYSIIAATIGSMLFFLFIRYVFGVTLQDRYREQLKAFNGEIAQYGYSYLLSTHFFMIIPLFIVNTLAGLTALSWWTFMWTTIIGLIPGTVVFALAGQKLMEIESIQDVFSPSIIIGLLLLLTLALLPVILRFCKRTPKKNGAL